MFPEFSRERSSGLRHWVNRSLLAVNLTLFTLASSFETVQTSQEDDYAWRFFKAAEGNRYYLGIKPQFLKNTRLIKGLGQDRLERLGCNVTGRSTVKLSEGPLVTHEGKIYRLQMYFEADCSNPELINPD